MRRLLCCFLCFLLCFTLFGCQKKEEVPILEPVEFFYLRSNFSYTDTDTIIGSELREASGHKEDLAYLIDLYLRGPQSEALAQTFPTGCAMVSFSTKGSILTLRITDQLSTLTGIDLVTACVCLAKTATELTGFKTVIIRAQSQLLDGKRSITIREGESALLDDYIAPIPTE